MSWLDTWWGVALTLAALCALALGGELLAVWLADAVPGWAALGLLVAALAVPWAWACTRK